MSFKEEEIQSFLSPIVSYRKKDTPDGNQMGISG